MQSVVIINEECHGFIGIAKDFENAVYFLIDRGWLNGATDVYYGDKWVPLASVLGEDWENKILALGLDDFCDFFDGSFYLDTDEIFERKS